MNEKCNLCLNNLNAISRYKIEEYVKMITLFNQNEFSFADLIILYIDPRNSIGNNLINELYNYGQIPEIIPNSNMLSIIELNFIINWLNCILSESNVVKALRKIDEVTILDISNCVACNTEKITVINHSELKKSLIFNEITELINNGIIEKLPNNLINNIKNPENLHYLNNTRKPEKLLN